MTTDRQELSAADPSRSEDNLDRLLARCLEQIRALELTELADSLVEPTLDPRWRD